MVNTVLLIFLVLNSSALFGESNSVGSHGTFKCIGDVQEFEKAYRTHSGRQELFAPVRHRVYTVLVEPEVTKSFDSVRYGIITDSVKLEELYNVGYGEGCFALEQFPDPDYPAFSSQVQFSMGASSYGLGTRGKVACKIRFTYCEIE